MKEQKKYKAAEGVKFVQYDEYGVPLEPDSETGFDYQKHIVTDDIKPSDMYIEDPPEMIGKRHAVPEPGIRRDIDKDPSKMTPEEREVFECLEAEEFDDEAGYDELEDDFLLLANEGKPALEKATRENDNEGVVFVKDEEAEDL